jgi:DNA-binding MltR family transcriptional regulator
MTERPRKPAAPVDKPPNPRFLGKPSGESRSLRDALKDIPPGNTQASILAELADATVSDEAQVIVGGTILEIALRDAITRCFRHSISPKEKLKLFDSENRGLLAEFSAKIKIAYALGVGKEKTRDDLNLIREVRNYFAHTPRVVKLSDREVRSHLEKINVIRENASEIAALKYKQQYS